ncbi:class I mannose-6-phosphate isomerase [Aquimarina addita]|uniref:Class I mannose-6-phosphate isomerase n=1 Tax=Aquimarina addita TaxID=870485 RepID=A0ABP7XBY5_9FLAO
MLYPLKFYPILKEKIWGGTKLKTLLNKPSIKDNIGESWEISTVGDDISIISNGVYEGKNLVELIKEGKSNLLGKKVYQEFGNQFPLLIKFIDAKQDLSIQLHPNDEIAKKRHNSFGKTEMWYVMQADKESELIIGFNKSTSEKEYIRYLKENRITELLNFENIKEGDSFFIDVGTIHAINSGVLIAEIQQTSDITYRIYDWDRKDATGMTRELHTDLALEALNYETSEDSKLNYNRDANTPNILASCKYFKTNYLKITENYERNYIGLDSFKVLLCTKGEGDVLVGNYKEKIKTGESLLIPAIFDSIQITSSYAEFLEVYIN